MVKILFKIMVCTDGVAVLLHCRSVRCYYFLLCMPWTDLLFPSYLMYFLSLHMQEAKGNSFARNKRLMWRLYPCHHGFRPWRGLLPLGCGRMFSLWLDGMWQLRKPLWPTLRPLLLTAAWAATSQCPHCHLPLTLSLPHCHHPFVPGSSLCEAADSLCSGAVSELWHSLFIWMWAALEQRWTKWMADVQMEMWTPCGVPWVLY